MERVLKVLVGVLIAIIVGGNTTISAVNASSGWTEGSVVMQSNEVTDNWRYLDMACGGEVAFIRVAYISQTQKACTFGEAGGVRMARYINNQGKRQLTVSYPGDSAFYIVRGLCSDWSACVYSHVADRLYINQQVSRYTYGLFTYKNISAQLERKFDPAIMGYYYTLDHTPEAVSTVFDPNSSVGRFGISRNGKWLGIEFPNRGIVRMNLINGEHRRVSGLNSQDSVFDVAISNDGNTIAVGGERYTPRIISIDDSCGDRLVETSTGNFPSHVHRCTEIYPEVYSVFQQFYSAERPYFLDNERVNFTVHTRIDARSVIYGPSAPKEPVKKVSYVALGDSFTSGEGESSDNFYLPHTNKSPHACHVSSRSYPYLFSQVPLLGQKGVALNAACSGAVMADITGADGYRGQGGRVSAAEYNSQTRQALDDDRQGIVPQVEFLRKYSPSLATIGIGGNDAGFMSKLKSCIAPGVCEWAKPGRPRMAAANEIDALQERYAATFTRVKEASPFSDLSVVGYPQIINDLKDASCGVLLGALLSHEERLFISKSIARLNTVMKAAAGDAGVRFISLDGAYDGARLCDSAQQPAMNGIRLGDDFGPVAAIPNLKVIGAESFHPTPHGHSLAAKKIADALGTVPVNAFRLSMQDDDYWREGSGGEDTVRYTLLTQEVDTLAHDAASYIMQLPPGVFAGNSRVRVSLQDTAAEYTITTIEDGSVRFDVPLPEYKGASIRSIYLTGESPSSEPIIGYRMIAMEGDGVTSPVKPRVNDSPAVLDSSPMLGITSRGSSVRSHQQVKPVSAANGGAVTGVTLGVPTGNPQAGKQKEATSKYESPPMLMGLGIASLVLFLGAATYFIYYFRTAKADG